VATRLDADVFLSDGAQVTMDDQGNSRGFGFVQFETAEEANEAISKVRPLLCLSPLMPFLCLSLSRSLT